MKQNARLNRANFPAVTSSGVAMETFTQQIAVLGGIVIAAALLASTVVPVLGPLVRFVMP